MECQHLMIGYARLIDFTRLMELLTHDQVDYSNKNDVVKEYMVIQNGVSGMPSWNCSLQIFNMINNIY